MPDDLPTGPPAHFSPPTGGTEIPRVPDHELLRVIGRGSYGEVWLARSIMGTLRAVKVVYRRTFDHDRPFEREFAGIRKFEPVSRQHDGVVDILQVGRSGEAGYFYYVMELADDAGEASGDPGRNPASGIHPSDPGPSSSDFAHYVPRTLQGLLQQRGRLPFEECLPLFLSLVSALGHLHRHGLIHRDIKPANIIFVHGVTKLADIGLVSEVGASSSYVGTEGYIPPEGPGTPQADLYSLGKLFYELSTGRDRTEFPVLGIELGEFATSQGLLELNAVITKACASDPRQRYQSTEEMQADLALLRDGRSVKRRRRLERRINQAIRLGAIVAVLTALGLLVLFLSAEQRRLLRESSERAEFERGRAEVAVQRVHEKERDARQSQWSNALAQARAARGSTQPGRRLISLAAVAEAAVIRPALELRDEAIAALALVDLQRLPVSAETRWIGALGPELDRYVDTHDADALWIRRLSDGVEIGRLAHPNGPGVSRLGFSLDGQYLWLRQNQQDLFLWDLDRRTLVQHERSDASILAVDITPAPQRLAVGYGNDNGVLVFRDLETGRTNRVLPLHVGSSELRFSPDGQLLALGGARPEMVNIVEASTGNLRHALPHPRRVFGRAWSPDSRHLAVACDDGDVHVWDPETGQKRQVLPGRGAGITSVVYLGRHDWLAAVAKDGRLVLWDVPGGHGELSVSTTALFLQFSPANGRLGWRSDDPDHAVVYQLVTNSVVHTVAVAKSITPISLYSGAFTPDGRWLAVGAEDGLHLFDAASGLEQAHGRSGPARSVAFSAASGALVMATANQILRYPVARTADEVVLGPPVVAATSKSSEWRSAAIDGGDRLLVGTQAGQPARVWRGGTALELARSANADTVAVSADGRWIAAHLGGESGAWVWDATTGRRVRELRGTFAMQAVFSPDSRRVATGTAEEYCLWDVLGGEPVLRLPREEGIRPSGPLAFSPDGRLLAIMRTLSLVQLVDPATGRELASLEHPDPRTIRCLAFNPAGTLLAAIANESVVQLWDLRRLRAELAGLKLDWEQPPLPRLPPDPDASSASPRRIRILSNGMNY